MATKQIKRIGLLTGGGDCPGLNAVIRAVTKTAIRRLGLEVMGIRDGFLGLIENRIQQLHFQDVSGIIDQGGTILGTSNKANPARFAVGRDAQGKPVFADVTDRVLEHLREHGIDLLVCIGGDGTMTCAHGVMERGIPVIGIPKTIDNDIAHTEVSFGFDTAVSTATESIDRIRTTAASHHRVMLVEMMGRNAGWITLYSGAAGGADVILLPEIPFDVELVCRACTQRSDKHKAYTLVAVAEGAKPIGGSVVVSRVVHESHDSVRLGGVSEVLCEDIAHRTGLECRATILGHVQRGGRPTARDRTLATEFGFHAVEMIREGQFNRMVTIEWGDMASVPLGEVAGRQKLVPLDHALVRASRAMGVSFGDAPDVP